MARKVCRLIHRLCVDPDLSILSVDSISTNYSDGIAFTLTSWELKDLNKSWISLKQRHKVGLELFASLFEKFPESKAIFGLSGASRRKALADYRVRTQALIVQDTIEMVINDLKADGDGLRWPLVCVGETHAKLISRGFKQEYLNAIVKALLDLVAQQQNVNRYRRWKLLRLWRRLLFFILSCLMHGLHLGGRLDRTLAYRRGDHTHRLDDKMSPVLIHSVDKPETIISSSFLLEPRAVSPGGQNEGESRRHSQVPLQLLRMITITVPMRV